MHYVKSVKTIGIDFLHVIVEAVKYKMGSGVFKEVKATMEFKGAITKSATHRNKTGMNDKQGSDWSKELILINCTPLLIFRC